jgi:hypothetical protein
MEVDAHALSVADLLDLLSYDVVKYVSTVLPISSTSGFFKLTSLFSSNTQEVYMDANAAALFL